MFRSAAFVLCTVVATSSACPAALIFDMHLSFSGLTPSQQAVFSTAEAMWESIITGYIGGGNPLPGDMDVDISATAVFIDGVGGTLGSAGPDTGVVSGGFLYAESGHMSFDTADIGAMESNGSLLAVILHEMAHVMGFGTLWNGPALSVPGTQVLYVSGTGQYTGTAALAAYQAEFNPLATFVPVELGGGGGTANAHWDEVNGGAGLTGIVGPDGDFAYELMTGWLNSPTYISETTKASFIDLGYTVQLESAVPEPCSLALLALGTVGLIGCGRRKRCSLAA